MRSLDITKVSKCRLCIELGKKHVPSFGDINSPLMIIGQSPGAEEVKCSEPFVGPSGELMENMLAEIPMGKEECYIANAIKCRPPKNRPAKVSELNTCYQQWLKREIKIVDPKVMLIVGKDAYMSILPPKVRKKLKFKHLNHYKFKSRVVVITYHPGYFLRANDTASFSEVGRILRPFVEEAMTEL